MKLFSELKRTVQLLQKFTGQWAICGGVAASVYRTKARFTDDIDFALISTHEVSAEELASKVIKDLNYKEYKDFVPDPYNNQQRIFALICAKSGDDQRFTGIDFLLPVQFWVEEAVKIAQDNLIDYGFDLLPTVTPESLLIAKLAALSSNPERYQDIDDIKEIIENVAVDFDFIRRRIRVEKLILPQSIASLFLTTGDRT